jgi:hypothetical protein
MLGSMVEGPRRSTEPHSHLVAVPEALEALFSRMGELKVVLGAAAAPGVDDVARLLGEGLAARERGEVPVAVARIGEAMERLAALASDADPEEGAALRAIAARFRHALGRGRVGEATAEADVMRERSGSVLTPRTRR